MTLPETILQRSLPLPEPAAREDSAFIQDLEIRYGLHSEPDDTEAFLAAVAGTLGNDFPDDITDTSGYQNWVSRT